MVLESGKKSLENLLHGGRDVLGSMAAKAATDSSLFLKRQDRLAVDRATNAVVRLLMSACLVFYVCVLCCALCAVCCVRCAVCRVSCVVCCAMCVVGFVLSVSVRWMPPRVLEYKTNQQCGSSHQELGCPPRRLQVHVEEDADAHLVAACSQASIG